MDGPRWVRSYSVHLQYRVEAWSCRDGAKTAWLPGLTPAARIHIAGMGHILGKIGAFLVVWQGARHYLRISSRHLENSLDFTSPSTRSS